MSTTNEIPSTNILFLTNPHIFVISTFYFETRNTAFFICVDFLMLYTILLDQDQVVLSILISLVASLQGSVAMYHMHNLKFSGSSYNHHCLPCFGGILTCFIMYYWRFLIVVLQTHHGYICSQVK